MEIVFTLGHVLKIGDVQYSVVKEDGFLLDVQKKENAQENPRGQKPILEER